MLLPAAALPETKLHILRAGVPAGRAVKGRFEPAHALFMAYGARCRNREELTLADPRTAAWLRGEEIPAQNRRARLVRRPCRRPAARRRQSQRRPRQKTTTPKPCATWG